MMDRLGLLVRNVDADLLLLLVLSRPLSVVSHQPPIGTLS
jgi:hypothetical protein